MCIKGRRTKVIFHVDKCKNLVRRLKTIFKTDLILNKNGKHIGSPILDSGSELIIFRDELDNLKEKFAEYADPKIWGKKLYVKEIFFDEDDIVTNFDICMKCQITRYKEESI